MSTVMDHSLCYSYLGLSLITKTIISWSLISLFISTILYSYSFIIHIIHHI